MPITIRQPKPSELQAVRQLRYEVLDADKGLPLKTSSDTDADPASVHMAAFDGDRLVCTVRLGPLEDDARVYRVRRMATSESHRNQGLGAKVLAAAEQEAIRRGAIAFVLDARPPARSFYARAGYWPTGQHPVFNGEEDISMAKQVTNHKESD